MPFAQSFFFFFFIYDRQQGYTFLMYTKPVKPEMKDWSSLYRSSKLDGFEIGDVSEVERNSFKIHIKIQQIKINKQLNFPPSCNCS